MKVVTAFVLMSMAALTLFANAANAESMKITHAGVNYSCDPDGGGNNPPDTWNCDSVVNSRDNGLLTEGCKGDTQWACYSNITETCTNTHTGRSTVTTRKRFDGCFASLSDCF